MKKLLTLIFSFCSIFATAQTIVDSHKVWNVISSLNFGDTGTAAFYFDGDTTIGAYQYKKLQFDLDTGAFFPPYPFAVREDTTAKQVFFRFANNESLAYDFSLSQGDTFFTNLYGMNIQMVVGIVDSVSLLNGEKRKRLHLSGDTWIEGIGSIYGLPYVGVYFYTVDIYPSLNCFSEFDTLKYESGLYPCYFGIVDVHKISSFNNFEISPNPFSDFAFITFENPMRENYNIKIFSPDGRVVFQSKNISTNNLKIVTANFKSGIYFIQLMNEKRVIANRKLIVE